LVLLGVNRSPSCGVESTSIDGEEQTGKGVFIKMLEEELVNKAIKIRMLGVKTSQEAESVERLKKAFGTIE